MRKKIFVFLTLFLGVVSAACVYNNAEEMIKDLPKECNLDAVSFNEEIAQIINQNCGSCHGATFPSGGLSLTNYTQISAAANSGIIMNRISRSPGDPLLMPTTGKMSSCNIDKIDAWIKAGAPNN